MQIPPASVLDAWPTPNYVDPVTRGNENVILNIVLYIILLLFVILRILTRTLLKRAFGADDILIVVAVIPTTAFFVLSLLADLKYAWTRHQYDIPTDHVVTGLKMVMSAEVCFAVACTLTKLSMLMFTRRLLENSALFWRRITLIAIFIVVAQGSIFCLTVIFQCRPPQDYWAITVDPQPNCIDQSSSLLTAGIINTLTDFMVVILPIRMVLSLRLPRRESFIVALLFACGFFSCFAGAARTYFMYETTQTYDSVWAAYPVWMTAAIELYVGVICASIPATKPFFSTYLPQVFGTSTSRTRMSSSELSTMKSTKLTGEGTEDDLLDLITALEKGYCSSSTPTTITNIEAAGHSRSEQSSPGPGP